MDHFCCTCHNKNARTNFLIVSFLAFAIILHFGMSFSRVAFYVVTPRPCRDPRVFVKCCILNAHIYAACIFTHFATIQIFTKPQRACYACFFVQNDAKFVATSTHFSCTSICQTTQSPLCPRGHSLINIFVHKNLWKTPQKNIKNCSKKPLT